MSMTFQTGINSLLDEGEEVSLYEMLDAREDRVRRQEEILNRYSGCVVSFSLNIPGRIKSCSLFIKAFDAAVEKLKESIAEKGIAIEFIESIYKKTGPECILSVNGDPESIKILTLDIEDKHPIGRLFDFDVIRKSGDKVSREDIGLPPRMCLLCSRPAFICARSRHHGEAELMENVLKTLEGFILNKANSRGDTLYDRDF